MSGNINHIDSTDTNHNAKSFYYQCVGGVCAVTIGNYIVDADLLRLSGISQQLHCPQDFVSDLLVILLSLFELVQKSMHIAWKVLLINSQVIWDL